MAMGEEEWLSWYSEPWAVVPFWSSNAMWVIVKASESGPDVYQPDSLTPPIDDEEVARHLVRAHNYYLKFRLNGEERVDDRGSESAEP